MEGCYKLSEPLKKALITQIQREYQAAFAYRYAYQYFDINHLKGIAGFFKKESVEEMNHAQLIEDYLLKRGESYFIGNIINEEPKYSKHLDVFERAATMER